MLWFKTKLVLEHYSSNEAYPKVSPAKKFIPEWYKKIPTYNPGTKVPIVRLPANRGVKSCIAFLDAFTTGYMLSTPVDIAVEQTEKGPSISWGSTNVAMLELRPPFPTVIVPTPRGCHPNQFAWRLQTGIKIPKGYSAIIGHPLNRHDLPFVTLSGIVDGEFVMHLGNLPVYFDLNFEGLIPAGTPFAQVVLFKREDWTSKYSPELVQQSLINETLSTSVDSWYKKNLWKKKHYD